MNQLHFNLLLLLVNEELNKNNLLHLYSENV